ncbi:MAG: DinB family protein [Candidatus Heimdallarchaeota archaeon]|nr:DinB family protein [Candidatus Heimdallarchaeota archaeon]
MSREITPMNLPKLYETILERRFYQLDHYKDVDAKIFHSSYAEDTWSAEAIFRHFLMSTAIMRRMITGEKKDAHPLAVLGGPSGPIKVEPCSIEEVEQALKTTSEDLLTLMQQLDENAYTEERKNFKGETTTLEQQLIGLLLHDSEHLGELKWTFKRLAGYNDNDMYRIKE